MDVLTAMKTFVRVAETGSFSAAARQIGIGQPSVSKIVAQLEEHLGSRLVIRTTKKLNLTEDGLRYLEAARATLDAAQAAEMAVTGRGRLPSGRLRLTTSVALGRLHIVPRLARFREQFPDVEVELILSDRFIDLVEEAVDVAIRIGDLQDSGLVARRIGLMRRATVARPDYWDRKGRPGNPTQLADHDCLIFSGPSAGDVWEYHCPTSGQMSVKVNGPLRSSVSDALREAVLGGLGVGMTPYWFWPGGELMDGTLEAVLPDYEPTSRPIQAVFPERRLVSPKVRAMVDFLADEFRKEPSLGGGEVAASPGLVPAR